MCCEGWVQNLGEEGKVRKVSCPACERSAGELAALPGEGDEPAESLWIRGQNNMGYIVVVCYTMPLQEEVVDESFFRQLEKPHTCRLLS